MTRYIIRSGVVYLLIRLIDTYRKEALVGSNSSNNTSSILTLIFLKLWTVRNKHLHDHQVIN